MSERSSVFRRIRAPSAGRGVRWPRLARRPLGLFLSLLLALTGFAAAVVVGSVAWVAAYLVVDPGETTLMRRESARLGGIWRRWTPIEDIPMSVRRAVIAAEDARFCAHWGVDLEAVRDAIDEFEQGGRLRGASTITQQMVKNVFLWPERSFVRKGVEVWLAVLVETFWTKERILEVYLNVAEFGEGVFGVEAGALEAYGAPLDALGPGRAALLVSVLPSPRTRSAATPSPGLAARARRIEDGAATLAAQERDLCVLS